MKLTATEIKHYREALGLSQGKLAKEIGISPVMLGFIERGERTLSTVVAMNAAEALYEASKHVLEVSATLRELAGKYDTRGEE